MAKLEVYVPQAPTVGSERQTPAAPRIVTLAGMRVGLLWNHKARGDVGLAAVGEELQRRFEGVKLVHIRGTNPTNDHVLVQAAEECDAVVGTTAD